MVGGQRAEFGRERRAAHVGKLLGVELDRQAMGARRLEHTADLPAVEGDGLAEPVDRVGEAGGGDPGDHLLANKIDVAVGVAVILGGDGMGAEEGGADRHVAERGQAARRREHPRLGLGGQAVPRLDLDGRQSLGEQGIQARQGGRRQSRLVGPTGRLHRRRDTAA